MSFMFSAYGNATSDAQQALNKAFNDYYTALKTGPAKTPAEQTKLREQIIGPAEVALNRAIQKDAASFDPNKAAQNGSAAAGANSSYRSNSRVNAGDSGAPAPAATAETPSNSAPIEATAPREIEFPGPLALPAASPSPAKKRAH
jgi:hypothetical protein